MPRIVIYTTPFCPYCVRAKRLLTQKGAMFEEIDVSGDWQARAKLAQKAGGLTTVPQIWIGDVHVGGSDELHALDRAGKLDALLGGV
jgi:glutaredoxin 3